MSFESEDVQHALEEEHVVDEDQEAEDEDDVAGDEAAEMGTRASGEFSAGIYNAVEVNDQVFEELVLDLDVAAEVQDTWSFFLKTAESRDAAGEAIYAALFDAAPSIQSLFKTPRAVMAMRFMAGLNTIISNLKDPAALKITVETLGFQHLDLEVTSPRVVIFRDAIVELLSVEIGARLTDRARNGWNTFLNYVGGAYIYVRVQYAERLRCLATSWSQANNKNDADGEEGATGGDEEAAGAQGGVQSDNRADESKKDSKKSKSFARSFMGSKSRKSGSGDGGKGEDVNDFRNTSIPQTFPDMFTFNAAVMGFGGSTWMQEILSSFDTVVTNVSNSYRLQEECDVLCLRMAKYKGVITLSQYKSVMLASLRSLVKDWGSLHEVSWSWLWENIERMISAQLGKPVENEAALSALVTSLDENALMVIRREIYSQFFSIAPAGQEYFKQSTTRLHFIADKMVGMTTDMYREPQRMVEDLSALGLRHVGYGIPTDLFGPFVTACVQVVRNLADDDKAEEAFRWSLNLISRILTRVINEGSTIVMKAINANSGKQLRKAVSCAPRGQRAIWMLNIQVGTQSISPLMWAIETGGLEAARAIITDLLTIRADRDRYYYGMDIMFERHPDLIQRLCLDAPGLLPVLLDGLIWRSRVTENGQRRVNYYIKHLIVNADGEFSPAIKWITDHRDPKVVCHPVIAMVTDMVWDRVALRTFIYGKTWFVLTLLVFVLSQAVLNHLNDGDESGETISAESHRRRLENMGVYDEAIGSHNDGHGSSTERLQEKSEAVRIAIFICRVFIYTCSLGYWIVNHAKWISADIRSKSFVRLGCLKVPEYLSNWQDMAGLCLMITLLFMLCMEPILRCLNSSDAKHLFTEICPEGKIVLFPYSIMSTVSILMYFLLLSDLSVFSTRVSAFVLVFGRVIMEVVLFLFGLTFFAVAFACAISSLDQDDPNFAGIPKSLLNLYRMAFGMFSGSHYETMLENPALACATFFYIATAVVFLLNLLIAQLNCAYQSTYLDMLGFARLNRCKIVHETMPSVGPSRWARFVESLRLDERVEFGEGDIGLAGGIQIFEPGSANITTVDLIRRFGGSTSPAAQWPAEVGVMDDADRFARMEKLIQKALKRMTGSSGKRRGGGSSTGDFDSSNSSGAMSTMSDDSQA